MTHENATQTPTSSDEKTELTVKSDTPLQLHIKVRPWVRYWARSVDYTLYSMATLSVVTFIVLHTPPLIPFYGWIYAGVTYFVLLAAVPVEAVLLSKFGTTPGKWLLNITVRQPNGEKLRFDQALKRSWLVWLMGVNLGIPIFSLIGLFLSYRALKKKGRTPWDNACSTHVQCEHVGFIRSAIATIILLTLPIMETAVRIVEGIVFVALAGLILGIIGVIGYAFFGFADWFQQLPPTF